MAWIKAAGNTLSMGSSESVLDRELENARSIEGVDHLKRSEAVGPAVGYQVAGLVEGRAIATGLSEGRVLDGVHSGAVLDIKIRVISHVERLSLQGDGVPLGYAEVASQPEINLLAISVPRRELQRRWNKS